MTRAVGWVEREVVRIAWAAKDGNPGVGEDILEAAGAELAVDGGGRITGLWGRRSAAALW